MAFYSFVQFISVVIIYWRSSIPSDTEYLYVDLLIIDVIALTATRNEGRIQIYFENHSKEPWIKDFRLENDSKSDFKPMRKFHRMHHHLVWFTCQQ